MTVPSRLAGFGLCLLVAAAWPASAAGQPEQAIQGFGRALAETDLADKRGGREQTIKTQIINGIAINGTAENINISNAVTGDNTVGGGSFAGAQGFPLVIQNTGNGVLIQNATILNVTVEQ